MDACHCLPVTRPPVWLMRQAGRALPEYRALKENHTVLELVQTPELAAEVTLQPIRRFGFDAAIIFSDILALTEGLGQPYEFQDGSGIKMAFLIESAKDVERLKVEAVTERLRYVAEALKLVKAQLKGQTALIGFAGSPWTLANFMLEGGGIEHYSKAEKLLAAEPKLFGRLMEKLTAGVIEFLKMQIAAGAEVVQVFDSLGGLLPTQNFGEASGRWMKEIVAGVKELAPVIVFSKGTEDWDALVQTGANVLGLDWKVSLGKIAASLPKQVGVQGNLEPEVLTTTPENVAGETRRILREANGRPGHIFNLGHGVPPTAKLENIAALVSTVQGFAL